jgi:glycosyltransferase involved in cell wall biosynthesis
MNENTKFTLIYCTSNRPHFIKTLLKFINAIKYQNYEVIISDNATNDSFSCKSIIDQSSNSRIKYVRTPKHFDMVSNYNFALSFATGDYIAVFTDKTFILPNTLSVANEVINKQKPDILNWGYVSYRSDNDNLEGVGYINNSFNGKDEQVVIEDYDCKEALSFKTLCSKSRNVQTQSEYGKGKIFFGMFSKGLVDEIISKTSKLFHSSTPDYSSMILGLSFATKAVYVKMAGALCIFSSISNGMQCMWYDDKSKAFLDSFEDSEEIYKNMLVPYAYYSQHNHITHEYLRMKRKFSLPININEENWLKYIYLDRYEEGRIWSSPEIKRKQLKLVDDYITSKYGKLKLIEFEIAHIKRKFNWGLIKLKIKTTFFTIKKYKNETEIPNLTAILARY